MSRVTATWVSIIGVLGPLVASLGALWVTPPGPLEFLALLVLAPYTAAVIAAIVIGALTAINLIITATAIVAGEGPRLFPETEKSTSAGALSICEREE